MDTVEVHLVNSISLAATTLFTNLDSLREIDMEATESVEKVQRLRKDLVSLDQNVAIRGLEILRTRQKRNDVQQLLDAVLQLKWIVDGVVAYTALVNEGEVEKTLAKIAAVELVMAGEADGMLGEEIPLHIRLRDMRGVGVVQGVGRDLKNLRFQIGRVQ